MHVVSRTPWVPLFWSVDPGICTNSNATSVNQFHRGLIHHGQLVITRPWSWRNRHHVTGASITWSRGSSVTIRPTDSNVISRRNHCLESRSSNSDRQLSPEKVMCFATFEPITADFNPVGYFGSIIYQSFSELWFWCVFTWIMHNQPPRTDGGSIT